VLNRKTPIFELEASANGGERMMEVEMEKMKSCFEDERWRGISLETLSIKLSLYLSSLSSITPENGMKREKVNT